MNKNILKFMIEQRRCEKSISIRLNLIQWQFNFDTKSDSMLNSIKNDEIKKVSNFHWFNLFNLLI